MFLPFCSFLTGLIWGNRTLASYPGEPATLSSPIVHTGKGYTDKILDANASPSSALLIYHHPVPVGAGGATHHVPLHGRLGQRLGV